MRSLVLIVGVVGMAFGSMSVFATSGTIASQGIGALTPPLSYVIGPADAPTGGEIVIGLLIPESDGRYVKDVLGPARYEAYLKREAEIARSPAKDDLGDATFEIIEEDVAYHHRHE